MYECFDSISEIVIPITILNLFGTAMIVLLSKCYDRWYDTPELPILYHHIDEFNSTVSLNERWSNSPYVTPNLDIKYPLDSNCPSANTDISCTDEDDAVLIKRFRKLDRSSSTETDVFPEHDITHTLSTKNELAGEHESIENAAGKIISITKNIAGALDSADHIPKEKKTELATLLKGIPDFITKIVDMDDEQLDALLNTNKSAVQGELSRNTIIKQMPEAEAEADHIDFLMKTLDSLRQ